MTYGFPMDVEVTVERKDDGRHAATINGGLVAKLSPYTRPG